MYLKTFEPTQEKSESTLMKLKLLQADYANINHQIAILDLMEHYATDIMGGGRALSDFTKQNLVECLSNFPGAFSVLAYEEEKAVGLINCFTGFSTFKCKPLVNIHDVIVFESHRGKGIAQQMLTKVEKIALDRGCCKLTLEVLSGNSPAKNAYIKFGFEDYVLDPTKGNAIFLEKTLKTHQAE